MSVQGTNQVAQEAPAQAVEGQAEQPAVEAKEDLMSQIGRASCRERV